MTPEPDYQESLRFLEKYRPGGPWVLTAITLDKKSIDTKTFRDPDKVRGWLEEYGQDRNIYFSVNSTRYDVVKKPMREDVASLDWLHIDIDPRAGENLKDEQARILGLLQNPPDRIPRPTFIIFSGGGYQGFWKLAEPKPINGELALYEDAKLYNLGLESAFGADSCHNVDRIMRLPGTVNRPDKRKREKGRTEVLAELVSDDAHASFLLSDFERIKAPPPRGETSSGQVVSIDTNHIERVKDINSLGDKVSDLCKVVIVQGDDPDRPISSAEGRFAKEKRSGALFFVCCELVRAGIDPKTIFAIITDPDWKISASVLDKGRNAEGYAVRQIERATEFVNIERGEGILVVEGRLNQILDEAEKAMDQVVFEYGSELVRIIRQENKDPEEATIRRDKGSLQIEIVNDHWLTQEWARKAQWFAPVGKDKPPRRIDPPIKYAKHYIARRGDRNIPVLRGFVTAPTLRRDGSVLDTPGYDAATGLIYEPYGIKFPAVPTEPTEETAREALRRCSGPFEKFPFVSPADRSVVLAMLLTGLIRRSLLTAPLFIVDAPKAGTGKTLIPLAIGTIVMGYSPTAMTVGASEEELEKRLFTILMKGDPVILLDNLNVPLSSSFLCSMLTVDIIQSRILGLMKGKEVPCQVLICATGNNFATKGDTYRRSVKCRIDAGVEHPEQRQFDFHPVSCAAAERPALVAAGLTALRWAYLERQRGRERLPELGSFEEWSWVRETLVWLGYADPIDTQAEIRNLDSESSDLVEILSIWHEKYPHQELTVKELWQLASGDQESGLLELMIEQCKNRTWSSKSFGRYLSRNKDNIVGGLQLTGREVNHQTVWAVRNLNEKRQKVLEWPEGVKNE